MSDFPGFTQRIVSTSIQWSCGHCTDHYPPEDVPIVCPVCAAPPATPRYRGTPLHGYAMHHINGDPSDNRPENIRLVPWGENRRKP